MKSVTTHEAKTHLSALIGEVLRGAEIEIRRGDQAVARLVPVEQRTRRRPAVGTVTSAPIRYEPDAFEPLSQADMERMGLL